MTPVTISHSTGQSALTLRALAMIIDAANAIGTEINLWLGERPATSLFHVLSKHLNESARLNEANVDSRQERIQQDYDAIDDRRAGVDVGKLFEACAVMVATPHIRAYLEAVDPMALRQARTALGLEPVADAAKGGDR